MSYVADAAREMLESAAASFASARRTLFLVAGLFALAHLLTIGPYLETAEELDEIEAAKQANEVLLEKVGTDVEKLASAAANAGKKLEMALDRATKQMIADFQALQPLVRAAMNGRVPPAGEDQSPFPGQWPEQQMQMQQGPYPNQQQSPFPGARRPDGKPGEELPAAVSAELHKALTAVAEEKPSAPDLMERYAETQIVAPAYQRAHQEWEQRIKPAYLDALEKLERATSQALSQAGEADDEVVDNLRNANKELKEEIKRVQEVEIHHDARVAESLGADWWSTVSGKVAYADAVTRSIAEQMDRVAGVAGGVTEQIEVAVQAQRELENEAEARQKELEQQFQAQSEQLTSLSGMGGALPIDLRTFIELFPLILGTVLGLLFLRSSEERRRAASAAEDLAMAAPEDREARQWLVHQALSARSLAVPATVTVGLVGAGIAWVWASAIQVEELNDPLPLEPVVSAALGSAVLLVAAGWDLAAVSRLARVRAQTP